MYFFWLIGGKNPGGKYPSNTKRDLIHWSFLGLGPFGSIGTLAFFMDLHPTVRGPSRLFKMRWIFGNWLVQRA